MNREKEIEKLAEILKRGHTKKCCDCDIASDIDCADCDAITVIDAGYRPRPKLTLVATNPYSDDYSAAHSIYEAGKQAQLAHDRETGGE